MAIADEAFEGINRAIRNTEKNLSNARKLFESYLNSIFTQKGDRWEEKKLGDIATLRNGLNFTKSNKGIAALKELKQSILQKAFTGELTADKGEK